MKEKLVRGVKVVLSGLTGVYLVFLGIQVCTQFMRWIDPQIVAAKDVVQTSSKTQDPNTTALHQQGSVSHLLEPVPEVYSMLCMNGVHGRIAPFTLCLQHEDQEEPVCDMEMHPDDVGHGLYCSYAFNTTDDWTEDDSMVRFSVDPRHRESMAHMNLELVLFNKQSNGEKWYATMRLGPPNLLNGGWVALVGRLYGTTLVMYLPGQVTESADARRGYESEIVAASRGLDMPAPAVTKCNPVQYRMRHPKIEERAATTQQPSGRVMGLGSIDGGTRTMHIAMARGPELELDLVKSGLGFKKSASPDKVRKRHTK